MVTKVLVPDTYEWRDTQWNRVSRQPSFSIHLCDLSRHYVLDMQWNLWKNPFPSSHVASHVDSPILLTCSRYSGCSFHMIENMNKIIPLMDSLGWHLKSPLKSPLPNIFTRYLDENEPISKFVFE
jgi:hypothetical protein